METRLVELVVQAAKLADKSVDIQGLTAYEIGIGSGLIILKVPLIKGLAVDIQIRGFLWYKGELDAIDARIFLDGRWIHLRIEAGVVKLSV